MSETQVDVLLVGGGVMSATLASLLMQLDPNLKVAMVERLEEVAHESTSGWNNAGTGHAGYCELNYTPQDDKGEVTINRALAINAAFETSLQFWAYMVEQQTLPSPKTFINATPHCSFVWGKENVEFLKKRHALLSQHHLFADMQYSEDAAEIKRWLPLIMNARESGQPVAATHVAYGSDVDFGALTRHMVASLKQNQNFELMLNQPVQSIRRCKSGMWRVGIKHAKTGAKQVIKSKFVFLGAGGAALSLLQKSGIAEGKGYGGFPVSGQWLVCKDEAIVKQHNAKVYGQAPIGAPPMSVPHLDTRIIDGKPALLFGPFAGFTTKFLKRGSFMDLIKSVRPNNLKPLVKAGWHNMDLTRYLVGEVFQTHDARLEALRQFYPEAVQGDWQHAIAGQRVQIIKKCDAKGGKLEFGTEIVAAEDGSLACLLGASPGASTSVQAMLQVIERCFAKQLKNENWQLKLKEMIPSYGDSLIENTALLKSVRARTLGTLQLI